MAKSTIHIQGKVAEVLQKQGQTHAKVVCDTKKLLISLENIREIELGDRVSIVGDLTINSIEIDNDKKL